MIENTDYYYYEPLQPVARAEGQSKDPGGPDLIGTSTYYDDY